MKSTDLKKALRAVKRELRILEELHFYKEYQSVWNSQFFPLNQQLKNLTMRGGELHG